MTPKTASCSASITTASPASCRRTCRSYIYDGVDPAITEVLRDNGLQKSDIASVGNPSRWAQDHPRSRRDHWGIPVEAAAPSWDVLARFGNMLSVSLIFVLQLDGGPGRVDEGHLHRCGVLVCARRRGRRNALRHRPRLIHTHHNEHHDELGRLTTMQLIRFLLSISWTRIVGRLRHRPRSAAWPTPTC